MRSASTPSPAAASESSSRRAADGECSPATPAWVRRPTPQPPRRPHTILVCSVAAFTVLLSNPASDEAHGASLTQTALASQLGDWAVHFLTIAIFLFAFSSILGNDHQGEANISDLLQKKPGAAVSIYRILVMVGRVHWSGHRLAPGLARRRRRHVDHGAVQAG